MENISLYSKLANLPEHMKAEVSDFIDFLLSKQDNNRNTQKPPKPTFGSGKGMFTMKPGFDDPLEDFKEYMH